mmetsp:Transcript_26049/g.4474  ORF Transcript_26049/g.4474 Transcript_26049/m.4474 type:complete len:84 (+) Transcript_26049:7275-7526(+)
MLMSAMTVLWDTIVKLMGFQNLQDVVNLDIIVMVDLLRVIRGNARLDISAQKVVWKRLNVHLERTKHKLVNQNVIHVEKETFA